jgi:hypothetical protein
MSLKKTEYSAPYRLRGYCTRKVKDNCLWRIHASVKEDRCTVVVFFNSTLVLIFFPGPFFVTYPCCYVQVRKNPPDHKCSITRRKKKVRNAIKILDC